MSQELEKIPPSNEENKPVNAVTFFNALRNSIGHFSKEDIRRIDRAMIYDKKRGTILSLVDNVKAMTDCKIYVEALVEKYGEKTLQALLHDPDLEILIKTYASEGTSNVSGQ